MTVSSQTSKETYDGNGITTIWDLPFRFFDNADIFVYLVDPVTLVTTPLTLGTDYTLYGAGLPEQFGTSPGKITTTVPVASGKKLYVDRIMAIEQLVDIVNQGKFFPEVHEDVFDHLTMLIQQSDANSRGAIRVAITDPEPTRLPVAGLRANLLMGFDSFGNPIPVAPVNGSAADLALMLANALAVSQGAAMIGRGDQVVNSIAELKTLLNGSPSKYAYVTGYYAAGDGGGGEYYLDAADVVSADNGGTIIVAADGGRWKKTNLADLNVHHFGARGNGITDDKPAFLAMFAANGGAVSLLDKAYNVNGITFTGSIVVIKGKTKPSYNAAYTQLIDGSIMIGNVNIRAGQVDVRGVGVDAGSARGIAAADGFVINAPVGGSGTKVVYRDSIVLGTNEVSNSHATLIQGFNDHDIEGNDTALHQFGIVVKGRNGFIKNTTGYRIRTATVYPKSDIPSVGGDVADATANTLIVDGVVSRANPTNTTCNAVYVHGSTLSLSNVSVSHVQSTYGNSGLRIAGGSDTSLVTSGVTFDDIKSERAVCGVDLFGYNYDTVGSNVLAINPTSGRAVQTSGNSYNYSITGIDLLISDPAIVSADAAQFNGIGLWDNFTVRNPYRIMSISSLIASVSCGNIAGDAKLALEGNLALVNSWGSSGGHIPRMMMGPKNCIHLTGWAAPAVATADQIATLPFPLSDEKFFACAARKTDSTYATVIVYVAGTSITLMTTARSTLTYIDLSGITFYLR